MSIASCLDRSHARTITSKLSKLTTGYVQTPGWMNLNDLGTTRPRIPLDIWASVFIPPAHRAMVTLLDLDLEDEEDECLYDWVELWVSLKCMYH